MIKNYRNILSYLYVALASVILCFVCINNAYANIQCGDKTCSSELKCIICNQADYSGAGLQMNTTYCATQDQNAIDFDDIYAGIRCLEVASAGTSEMNSNYSQLIEVNKSSTCPLISVLKAKYQAGCWPCLIIEKLTSSFLVAASISFDISQKAGMTILSIGVVLWLLIWGLKNVSSFSQVEPANIVNELIKFLFTVAICFWFIIHGKAVIREYFITPIMGIGSIVAQTFWPTMDGYKDTIEEFEWDEYDYDEIDKAYEEALEEQSNPSSSEEDAEQEIDEIVDDEIKDLLIQAHEQEPQMTTIEYGGVSIPIPAFQVPGTVGTFVSGFGCRPNPATTNSAGEESRGSSKHAGIDIAAPAGTTIYAIGSGTITYSVSSSAGNTATIDHGNGWVSVYFHMLDGSNNYAINMNKASGISDYNKVVATQQVGMVGTTGNSGGNHLHLGVKYNGEYVDPLRLTQGIIFKMPDCPAVVTEDSRTPMPDGFVRDSSTFTEGGIPSSSEATIVSLASSYNSYTNSEDSGDYSLLVIPFKDVKYTGPVDIMPASVMNSILKATKALNYATQQNMILGEAVMCYAKLPRGGAWNFEIKIIKDMITVEVITVTNIFMWIAGAIIYCFGLALTISFAFYLIDISFKLGFAVLLFPIAVALRPFNMTKGKLKDCISIIIKAAATFAILAMATTFIVLLTDSVLSYGETADNTGETGLLKLYNIFDEATSDENSGEERVETNMEYAREKLALFGTTFILLIFAFLYSLKLLQTMVKDLVNKFFPDNVFGNSSPMHSGATAVVSAGVNQAKKVGGLAADIATHQAARGVGNAAKGVGRGAVKGIKKMTGVGKSKE